MNPTSSESAGVNLPPPATGENLILPEQGMAAASPELAMSGPEIVRPVNSQPPSFMLPVPTAPLPVLPITNVSSTTNSSSPSVADDADLIEKEWVQKAKEIIKSTQTDPHEESKELNLFKADYMQKRYNKVLKLSE